MFKINGEILIAKNVTKIKYVYDYELKKVYALKNMLEIMHYFAMLVEIQPSSIFVATLMCAFFISALKNLL